MGHEICGNSGTVRGWIVDVDEVNGMGFTVCIRLCVLRVFLVFVGCVM